MNSADINARIKAMCIAPATGLHASDVSEDLVSAAINPESVDFNALRQSAINMVDADPNALAWASTVSLWMLDQNKKQATVHGIKLMEWLCDSGFNAARVNLAVQKFIGSSTSLDPTGGNGLLLKVKETEKDDLRILGTVHGMLGDSYRSGRGFLTDFNKAIEHYSKGAELGNPAAAFSTGLYYDAGPTSWGGSKPNLERAFHFYSLGHKNGSVRAQTNLAIMHLARLVPGTNWELGKSLLRSAAAEGDTKARDAILLVERLQAEAESALNSEMSGGHAGSPKPAK